MPVGMCVSRTAESVLLTCCPPAPVARNVSIRISSQFSSTSRSSLDLRQNLDQGERGLAAFLRVERADPNEPVDAALGLEEAVGRAAVDRDGDALDARLLAFGLVQDLGPEAVSLGPAEVHPQQHLGPIGGFGPAGAGADRQEGVALVVFAAEEQLAPRASCTRARARRPRFDTTSSRLLVALVLGELEQLVRSTRREIRRSRHSANSSRSPSASRRTFFAAAGRPRSPARAGRASSSARRLSLVARSKTPRGRLDPLLPGRGSRPAPLGAASHVLEKDRTELDQAQSALAPGDDGVHAGAVGVVGADAAVAIAIEGSRIAAVPAVSLTGDEIDECRFLSLLHYSPR